jgi:hypothetical protein
MAIAKATALRAMKSEFDHQATTGSAANADRGTGVADEIGVAEYDGVGVL